MPALAARLLLPLLLAAAFALTAAPTPAVEQPPATTTATVTAAHRDEDYPAFDCRVDGDLACGVTASGGPVLAPAADGGQAYQCPDGAELGVNGVGRVVCFYGRTSPRPGCSADLHR